MAKKKNEKQEFGDIIHNDELVKRTLMVAAFPGLIKKEVKDGKTVFNGFLPGFEFAEIDNIADENEIVETLQDMLDDEVEELVVFGKSLPFVDEDEVLMEKYPEHKIVYLDINVYATPEELEYYDACNHDCANCHGDCIYDEEEMHHHCDCGCEDDDCGCEDDDCDCGCGHEHHHHHEHDCCCDDDCDCEDDECDCHEHEHEDGCCCGHEHENEEDCCCGHDHKHDKDHECKCKKDGGKENKNCHKDGTKKCKSKK